MSRAGVTAAWLRGSILLLAAHASLSCSEDPARPQPPLHRTVAVRVADSLLVATPGAAVSLVSEFDSAGFAQVLRETTDGAGVVAAVLAQGPWGAYAREGGSEARVAGATFWVPGRERDPADTLVVDLTLRAASRAWGQVRLAGRDDHSGTLVACPPTASLAVTDSGGSYALDQLPLGSWILTFHHPGFRLGTAPVAFAAPGAVQVAATELQPLPGGHRPALIPGPSTTAPCRP